MEATPSRAPRPSRRSTYLKKKVYWRTRGPASTRLLDGVAAHGGISTQVRKQGARATSTLNALKAECPAVVDVRGPGLMLGVEFDRSLTGFAGQVSRECEENGLLALTAGVHE